MSEIDWNDPDICKKYQTRCGQPILAVHCPPEWVQGQYIYPVCIRHANMVARVHTIDGKDLLNEESDYDIVPIPREPRTREPRTVECKVEERVFLASFAGDAVCYVVPTTRIDYFDHPVRVKITEVIE